MKKKEDDEKTRDEKMHEFLELGIDHYQYAPISGIPLTFTITKYGWDISVFCDDELVDSVHYKTIVPWINGLRMGILLERKLNKIAEGH